MYTGALIVVILLSLSEIQILPQFDESIFFEGNMYIITTNK
jgi:hypothetical protein